MISSLLSSLQWHTRQKLRKSAQLSQNVKKRQIYSTVQSLQPTPSGTNPESFICFIAVGIYCSNRPLNLQSLMLN